LPSMAGRPLWFGQGQDSHPERPGRPRRDLEGDGRLFRRRRPAPRLRHVSGAHRPAHNLGLRLQGRAARRGDGRLARDDPGRGEGAEDKCVPGEPQPAALPEGARRFDPRPRDPRERRALYARGDSRPGRPRPALLRDGARLDAPRRRAVDRPRLLPGRARPDRPRPGARGARRSPRGPHPAGVSWPPGAGRYDKPVAVTVRPKLDAHALRADFPVFERPIHGKPLAYLDSANSSQKPRQLLDAMWEFYGYSYANIHRGVYDLAERATAAFEGARDKVQALINAPSRREVIFTRNVTEALNLVAYSWGLDNLGRGDVVVITELEHHGNFVPWQQIARRTGAEFRAIPFDGNGELVLDGLDELTRAGDVKVVAANWISNTLGTINPVDKLTEWAHEQGAIMVVDAAQAVPHRPVDVQALGADFLGFQATKPGGPGGAGALSGGRKLLEKMAPFEMGGEMIRSAAVEQTTWNDLPYKFEAGTPAIAEAYGLGIAIDYITRVGLQAIAEHE